MRYGRGRRGGWRGGGVAEQGGHVACSFGFTPVYYGRSMPIHPRYTLLLYRVSSSPPLAFYRYLSSPPHSTRMLKHLHSTLCSTSHIRASRADTASNYIKRENIFDCNVKQNIQIYIQIRYYIIFKRYINKKIPNICLKRIKNNLKKNASR